MRGVPFSLLAVGLCCLCGAASACGEDAPESGAPGLDGGAGRDGSAGSSSGGAPGSGGAQTSGGASGGVSTGGGGGGTPPGIDSGSPDAADAHSIDGGTRRAEGGTMDASDAAPDGGAAYCAPFEACGGDPVGSWDFVGACFLPETLEACPDITVEGEGTVAGTLVLSESSRAVDATTSYEVRLQIPMSCIANTTCAQAYAGFGANVGAVVDATEEGEVCTIEITQPAHRGQVSTGITLEETQFVDEDSDETAFCREGDQLRLRELDNNPFGVVYTLRRAAD